jgi:hypothetical protein
MSLFTSIAAAAAAATAAVAPRRSSRRSSRRAGRAGGVCAARPLADGCDGRSSRREWRGADDDRAPGAALGTAVLGLDGDGDGLRELYDRGVRTFAVAWILGANEPGFHVVLKDGDEFAIGPSRRTDVFLLITQNDQQVSLD